MKKIAQSRTKYQGPAGTGGPRKSADTPTGIENAALSTNWMTGEQDQRISEAFGLERARLQNFIRRRVADEKDVEDVL